MGQEDPCNLFADQSSLIVKLQVNERPCFRKQGYSEVQGGMTLKINLSTHTCTHTHTHAPSCTFAHRSACMHMYTHRHIKEISSCDGTMWKRSDHRRKDRVGRLEEASQNRGCRRRSVCLFPAARLA